MMPMTQRMPIQMSPREMKHELPECHSSDSERMEMMSSSPPVSPERAVSPSDSPSKRYY